MAPKLYSMDMFDDSEAQRISDESGKKEKKPRTEKQIEGLKKAAEARKRKRDEKEANAKTEKEHEEKIMKDQEEAAIKAEEKKKAQSEKRKAARLAKKNVQESTPSLTSAETAPSDKEIEEQVDDALNELLTDVSKSPSPKKKKIRVSKKSSDSLNPEIGQKTTSKTPSKDETPPAWFRKYVSGVKKEENSLKKQKAPKRQLDEEVEEVAHRQWGDGMVRDRVRNEVDGHMGRMYGMIFGQRRMI